MIIDIDDKAREKIKMWDKFVSDNFFMIFNLVCYDFFDTDENIFISNYEGNSLTAKGNNNNFCYISYIGASDIFDNEFVINNNNKSFEYKISSNEHGVVVELKEIKKRINNNILDISILGYGVVIKLFSDKKIDVLEFRGKQLSIDYYKLMSSEFEKIKDITFITDCIDGKIDKIVKNQYDNKTFFYESIGQENKKYKILSRRK